MERAFRCDRFLVVCLGAMEEVEERYFKDKSFMKAELGSNPSWVWRSIWESKNILTTGIQWSIGNGEHVRIDEDPWVPMDGAFKLQRLMDNGEFVLVKQLINPSSTTWKEDIVSQLFVPDHARCILSIPLSWTKVDKLVWHQAHAGIYNVSSGYLSALNLKNRKIMGNGDEGGTD
ncbi:hypothetical protein RHSIM_Rhsim02G0166400 [Rhododendron simsii]|uniref:Uncharacterized protein n=1 Tax=Rhododendron simsii TaxID=118357 RepID=A0A834HBK1_RHOSS|nr:hypothetical protein RHSIM_Rhsim02G0166400 [Rhododendron simsii]